MGKEVAENATRYWKGRYWNLGRQEVSLSISNGYLEESTTVTLFDSFTWLHFDWYDQRLIELTLIMWEA